MAVTTSIDGVAIDLLITRLRGLVPPWVLAGLQQPDTARLRADGGLLDAARWLDDVVEDRRHALADQVGQLHTLFGELADELVRVRGEISLADSTGAAILTARTREPT
jgi:hypothetical protein